MCLIWAIFLCLLYAFGGEAGQTASSTATAITFVVLFFVVVS